MTNTLIQKINQSFWWHVPPRDPGAYKKRGKFLASTYLQAEFYGKPNDELERVKINNPVFVFSEKEILNKLFGAEKAKNLLSAVLCEEENWYQKRIDLDQKIHKRAKELRYDAIVLLTNNGKKELKKQRKPSSIELNLVFNVWMNRS